MRIFHLTELDQDRPTIFLLNGGGQRPYSKFHKAFRLFKPYNCNLISLELPGHGKSAFNQITPASEIVREFVIELEDIIQEYSQVGLFGFSLGALLSLKATELLTHNFMFTLALGAPLKLSSKEEQIMQKYATIEFFSKMKWADSMLEYHKDGWTFLMESLQPMLRVGSELFINPKSYKPKSPVYVVLGNSDEVADYRLQEEIIDRQDMVQMIVLDKTSHFDYFSHSWDLLQEALQPVLDNYLEKTLH